MTGTIIWQNEEWIVSYRYYAGTNYPIHSGSLEPNELEEFEIEEFSHEQLSEDFCDFIYNSHEEDIIDAAYDQLIKS